VLVTGEHKVKGGSRAIEGFRVVFILQGSKKLRGGPNLRLNGNKWGCVGGTSFMSSSRSFLKVSVE